MHRMGHGTMRAALIYQHATSQRDREIADALGARIERDAGTWLASGPRTPGSPVEETNDRRKSRLD